MAASKPPGDDSDGASPEASDPRVTMTVAIPAIDPDLGLPEPTASLEPVIVEPGPRSACLVVLGGPQEGDLHKLPPGTELVLGRSDDASLRLDDEGVSRAHARVVVSDARVQIEDLGSRNGTFVNHNRITSHELQPEDVICVGASTVLKLTFVDQLQEQFLQRFRAAALRDQLTGLFNRRHFDHVLAVECAAARRHGRPLSLVLLDVDDFKRINDDRGHPAGDAVLRELGAVLLAAARREDQMFRFGGEEFAVLTRETGRDGAIVFAERLRRAVASRPVPVPTGPPVRVTISLGISQLDGSMSDHALVAHADGALYAAKRGGKDRVVCAPTA
jgi:diguanylate cyclase (GGDEF)-like protein